MPENIGISPGGPTTLPSLRQGRYLLVGSLGSGSQGETLEAVDKREGRPVAIKRFTIRGAKSWKDVELAEREATVLAALNHSSLPRYIEHFEEEGALYLVMEKVEGETLSARRKRGAVLSQEQVLRFLREAGASLRYLHGHAPPIVHRDIKPGNVILRPDGSYCLVDFGSVRDRLKPEGGSTVVGTFGFMAPEQFQGRAAPSSDVYAVGATALSLLTGSEPEDLPHKGLAIDVEAALRGQVDRRLIGVLRGMLEPDPERRASSVEQALLAHGLSEPLAGESAAQAAKKARQARLEAEGWQRPGGERHHERTREKYEREARKQGRHAEREARRQGRRAERAARRYERWHRPGRPVLPARVLGRVLLLAFLLARLATFALFQVLLPTLFTLLTVVGGQRMRARGRRMIEIGRAGDRGLELAGQHIRHQFLGGQAPVEHEAVAEDESATEPARTEKPPRRARVSMEADLDNIEEEIEREIETALEDFVEGRRRRR
ncbi:MAG TPA: serine/threonine-protein kinase [Polyangiaceae bacterium]|nr:serine/threonine-protein kinase [Polyangiaceae bacterium]